MSTSVLVAYATKKGSTAEVARAIGETLREHELEVTVGSVRNITDVGQYDGVVLGGALYMGRWHRGARRFLKRYRKTLATVPLATYGMGPMKLDEKQLAGSRKQLDRALAKVPEVKPVSVAVFGGVVDPTKLHFPFNHMPASDARDWDAIHAWADAFAAELGVTAGADTERVPVTA